MSGTWEATHVRADLGDDGRSSHGSTRWQGQQELHGFFLLGNEGGNVRDDSVALVRFVDNTVLHVDD